MFHKMVKQNKHKPSNVGITSDVEARIKTIGKAISGCKEPDSNETNANVINSEDN